MKTALKHSTVALSLLLVFAFAAFAHPKDLSGRWTAPFNREGTPVTIVMNLAIAGDQVTGTITTARGVETKIENGKLDGANITFDTVVEGTNGRKFNVHYTGEASEEVIKLHAEVNGQQGGPGLTFHRGEK